MQNSISLNIIKLCQFEAQDQSQAAHLVVLAILKLDIAVLGWEVSTDVWAQIGTGDQAAPAYILETEYRNLSVYQAEPAGQFADLAFPNQMSQADEGHERQRPVVTRGNVDQRTNENEARAFKRVQLTWPTTAEEMRIQFRH
ncbi:E3 ubiquitin-protein ligase [Trichinella pseudospiralis]